MSKAVSGDRVKVHYTGTLADGTRFDSSEGREPLEFVIGEGKVISGFDKAVTGLQAGESKTVTIPCDEAYGSRHEQLVMSVERSQFPADVEVHVGQHFQFDSNDGSTHIFRVLSLDDELVTMDGNHPLAGKDLTFEVRLVEICQ